MMAILVLHLLAMSKAKDPECAAATRDELKSVMKSRLREQP